MMTMGALKTFASTKYVACINYLTTIFVAISSPTLKNPTLPSTKETVLLKDGSSREISSSTTEELEEFKMKLKDYLKDEKYFLILLKGHYITWYGDNVRICYKRS